MKERDMNQKFIYLLELHEGKKPTNIGVFSSRKKGEQFLKELPKKYAYAIYKLPLNVKLTKGPKLKDQQGIFDHWHYGTQEIEYVHFDDNGNILDQGKTSEFVWPK
jgi:hypothetical protein